VDTTQSEQDRALADSLARLRADSLYQDSLIREEMRVEQQEELEKGPILTIIQKRKAANRTSVLSDNQLRGYAVVNYPGFEMFGLAGETVQLEDEGIFMAQLGWEMRKGNQVMKVRFSDLNGYERNLVSAYLAHYREVHFRSRREINDTWKLAENIMGYEILFPLDNKASVSLLVGHRFVISIDGVGFTSTEELKKYIQTFRLQDLAALGAL
jgi:hypothetical protein